MCNRAHVVNTKVVPRNSELRSYLNYSEKLFSGLFVLKLLLLLQELPLVFLLVFSILRRIALIYFRACSG